MKVSPALAADTPFDDTASGDRPRLRWPWYAAAGVVVACCVAIGLGLRLWIMQSYVGRTNSDEAVTGLMALNILNGHLPVLIEGSSYGGTLEAFLLAPAFAFVGADAGWLKGFSVAEWFIAAVLLYFVARLVLGRLASLAAACIFWVTSGALIYLSTFGYSGYATGMCVMLGAFWVIGLEAKADEPTVWRAFFGGFLAGAAVWLHPMFVALLGPALLVVTWRHRRAIVSWLVPAVSGGVLALVPMLAFNAANGWPSLGNPYSQYHDESYLERLGIFFTKLLPIAFGFRDPKGFYGPRNLTTEWIHGLTLGRLLYALLLVAVVLGWISIARRGWPGRMLAISALAVPFVLALFNALAFYDDGRYGVGFMIFVVIGAVAFVEAALRRFPTGRRLALLALPLVWIAVLAVPSTRNIVPAIERGPDDEMVVLTRVLDEAGIDRVRTDYWIAYRLAFFTDQRIKPAVIPRGGYMTRFPYLDRSVDATDPHGVAWVSLANVPVPDPAFGALPIEEYEQIVAGPFVVYVPSSDA
jgi:hypothetical protein